MNGTNEFGDTLIEDQPANEFGDVQLPDTVVRDVAPGSLEVHHLLPAIRKMGGELAIGEQGDTHPEIISREDIPAEDIDQRGFVGSNGAFYDRETAAKGLQIPTEFEAGRLHSTDLSKAQEAPPKFPSLKISPYEQAEIAAGHKVETGMEPGTELLTSVASDIPRLAKGAVELFTPALQTGTDWSRLKRAGFAAPVVEPVEKGFTYAGNLVRAIPADIAETIAGNEKYYDMLNVGAAALGENMPIDEALNEAASENKTWATVGKLSQGLAASAPMVAAFGYLPPAAQQIALASFTANMIKEVPEIAAQLGDELGKPVDQQDPAKISSLVSQGIQDVGFGTIGAYAMARGPLAIKPTVKEFPGRVGAPAIPEAELRTQGTTLRPDVVRAGPFQWGAEPLPLPDVARLGAAGAITASIPKPAERPTSAEQVAPMTTRMEIPKEAPAPEGAVRPFEYSPEGAQTKLADFEAVGKMTPEEFGDLTRQAGWGKTPMKVVAEWSDKMTEADVPKIESLLEQSRKDEGKYRDAVKDAKTPEQLNEAMGKMWDSTHKSQAFNETLRQYRANTAVDKRIAEEKTTDPTRINQIVREETSKGGYEALVQRHLATALEAKEGFEGKPMEADAIWKRLEDTHGIKKGGAVELINDPKEAAGVIFPDATGKPIRIVLNQAKLATHGQIDWVLQHEAAHWFDLTNPTVTENIMKTVPNAEWEGVFKKVVDLGYSEEKVPYEISARSIQKLADSWRGRGWFDKFVGNVQRFAHETLGIKMTRRAAENTSVRAIAQSIKRISETAATKPDVSAAMAAWRQRTAPTLEARTDELVGAGAALAGERAPGAQIEQLTQALQNVRESRAPLAEQVKEAFSLGDRLSAAKDTLGRAISGLKATGDLIIKKWQGVPNIDDLLRAKKSLSKAIESRGWRLQQWEKAAYRAVPNPRDQAAIAKWVDAGGDRAALEKGLAEAPAKYKRAYQDALNLSGDKLTAAQNVQNYFESRLQEAIDAGVLDHGVENYLHRIYENKPALLKRALAYTQTGLLNKNPALAKKRFFQFDWEAEKEGYTPVQSFIKRITAYEASLSKAIAAREFIKSASEMKAADGRPIVDIKGVGIPVEDAAGLREGTLIKPKFNPAKNNEPTLPNGDPNPNYRGDYVNRDYRALSRWKWAGTDAGGKPIFVQGDVAIHPDYVGRVDALLKPSQVRFGKFGAVLRPALGVSSTIKQTMLDLSGFHPVQITVHGLEHRVLPWKIIQDIDLSHPDVDGLLQGGVTLGGDYSGIHREGLVGASLTRKVPWLGPVMESYHQWLFQSYIPRIKMTMALHALERNRARYAGRLTDEQIFHKTASEANAAFGELNYTVLERSKTAQDMARLILLAPDFLEARSRFAAQAFQRGGKMFGNEQRTALLLGALTMWVTARIANKMVGDQYHFEPENMFNIVKDGHAYGLRTVQGDILHLLTKPMQFTMSRLNPVYARTILEALTGRDYFGRKRSPAEQVWDAASTTIPISLRSNRERTIWESLANAFGVTARRYSDVDDAFKLAQKWKDTHAIPERGEFIYDPNKDVLRPLKLALNHGDEAAAAVEIKKLVDSKVYTIKKLDEYFKRFASMPFTGSKANDKKFVTSLTEDQRKTVEAARQHKNEIRKLYMKSRSQYLAPASTL